MFADRSDELAVPGPEMDPKRLVPLELQAALVVRTGELPCRLVLVLHKSQSQRS